MSSHPYKAKQQLPFIVCVVLLMLVIAAVAYKNNMNRIDGEETIQQMEQSAEETVDTTITLTKEDLAKLISRAKEDGKNLAIKEESAPFKPILEHTDKQNIVALAIGIFGESRGESEQAMKTIAWAIVNRAIDTRNNKVYQPTIAGVLYAGRGSQYSSMSPYLEDLTNIAWGRSLNFVPMLAKKNPKDMTAWKTSLAIATDLINGKLPRAHNATHFISLRGMAGAALPTWISDLKPVFVASGGLHIFFVDYITDTNGERIYFTKSNPYVSAVHDKITADVLKLKNKAKQGS